MNIISSLLPVFLIVALAGRCAVTATITIPSSGKQYSSVPEAAFQHLTFGVEYLSRLQHASEVSRDPYLCHLDFPDKTGMIIPSDGTPGKFNCLEAVLGLSTTS